MATIRDIAEKLGVSVSTVSKGLNGGRDISDSLRQSVLETAVELGYTNRKNKKEDRRQLRIRKKHSEQYLRQAEHTEDNQCRSRSADTEDVQQSDGTDKVRFRYSRF